MGVYGNLAFDQNDPVAPHPLPLPRVGARMLNEPPAHLPGAGAPHSTGHNLHTLSLSLFFFLLFAFLGLHSWHMESPRLGVESEL